MKFKTIVITRKKVIFTFVCVGITLLAVCIAALVWTSEKTAAVFKYEEESYEEILKKGLPAENKDDFSAKKIISKIIGFDFESPQTIIESYSASFENVQANNDNEQEIADVAPVPEMTEKPSETQIPVQTPEITLPDKQQICSSVGLSLNNATNYSVDIDSMCGEELDFNISDDGPQVLVVHTHTTECYDGDQMSGETERTTDGSHNVVEIGNVICQTLESYGIKTCHDTTYHDYPSYQGAYTRTLGTISSRLKEYPSIKVVLDIHRDAFIYSDGSKLTVSCEQNGVSTAQVMLVCGTDSMGLEHNKWRENLKLAAKIQNAAEIMYPGLMRPINLRTERFNMHMTTGSLLLEVGSNGNTLEEAKAGGIDVARAIAAVLKNQ